MLLRFLLFSVLFVIVVLLLEKGLNKLFKVKKGKISETDGEKLYLWGRIIIVTLCICTIIFFYYAVMNNIIDYNAMNSFSILKWFWIFYFSLLIGFQSFLEWKYFKQSKQYLTTLILLIVFIGYLYSIEYLIN